MAHGFANSAIGLAMASSLVALWSCADALRLEPPEGSGGSGNTTTTTSGGGGEGGQAPQPCTSNTDCAAPASVCDAVKGLCFECLEIQHCAHKPGTVCDAGSCNCPGGDTYCGPGQCIDTDTDPANCGSCGHECFGACVDGECADPWEPVASDGAPSPRARHVAVWTGSEMIVWGGASSTAGSSSLGDGGVYSLDTYEWTPVSSVNAPAPRQYATAVWTGDRMIVWGGLYDATYYNDGGVFDPATNTWEAMSTVAAPSGRVFHSAVWTGTEMIVWGGSDDTGEQLPSGGRYNPTTDTWTPTAAVPTPSESRSLHSAVWNGNDMLLYGGLGDVGANLDVYLPAAGAPGGRSYGPAGNSWLPLSQVGEPAARAQHSAVWDGTRMLIFGGTNGAAEHGQGFKYESNSWVAFSGTPPAPRYRHTAVWIDNPGVMVVWGGTDSVNGPMGTGGVYNPATNSWEKETPVTISARYWHTAVSTGSSMIVFGGFNSSNTALGDGGVYTP